MKLLYKTNSYNNKLIKLNQISTNKSKNYNNNSNKTYKNYKQTTN